MKARADAAGTVRIGGDLKVHRLGFGAMRITGLSSWANSKVLCSNLSAIP